MADDMVSPSAGGMAQWLGLLFETRVGVEFCTRMLLGENAGLLPGAIAAVQPQPPGTVDDLLVTFADGTRWEMQLKSGRLTLSWRTDSPFAQALLQLYRRFQEWASDPLPDPLLRLELVVDHRASARFADWSDWLGRAKAQSDWEGLARICGSARERGYLTGLSSLLPAADPEQLLAFLKRFWMRRVAAPDEWRERLRSDLVQSLVADVATAERLLDVLALEIQKAAPNRRTLTRQFLLEALSLHGIVLSLSADAGPRHSFSLLDDVTQERLAPLLPFHHPLVLRHPIARPELAEALRSKGGILVLGKPGSGKSHALLQLAVAQPGLPAVVLGQGFRADDVAPLLAAHLPSRFQLLCDDVDRKTDVFGELVDKLLERGHRFRVLASCRKEEEVEMRRHLDRRFWRRSGVQFTVELRDLTVEQADELCAELTTSLELEMDSGARSRFARHVVEGDGGPLFAVASAQLIRSQVGSKVRSRDIAYLPLELIQTWSDLYDRLEDRPHARGLLQCLRFLYEFGAPFDLPTLEALFCGALEFRAGELVQAEEVLTRELWIARQSQGFTCHIVSLEAVPRLPAYLDRFVEFAARGAWGDPKVLGRLRHELSLWYFQGSMEQPPDVTASRARHAAAFATLALESARSWAQPAELGVMLLNASTFGFLQSAFATESRFAELHRARELGEESLTVLRIAGDRAPLQSALDNSLGIYREVALLTEERAERRRFLEAGLRCAEESIELAKQWGEAFSYALAQRAFLFQDLAGVEESATARVERLREAADNLRQVLHLGAGVIRAGLRARWLASAAFAVWALAALEEDSAVREGEIEEAESYLRQAARLFKKEEKREKLVRLYLGAFRQYRNFAAAERDGSSQIGLLSKAAGFSGQAVDLARELGWQAELVESLDGLSMVLLDIAMSRRTRGARGRDLEKARAAIEEAVQRSEGLPRSSIYRANAGLVYWKLAEGEATLRRKADLLRKAETYLEQALAEAAGAEVPGLQEMVFHNLATMSSMLANLATATVEEKRQRLEKGARYAEMALALGRRHEARASLPALLQNAALIYKHLAALAPSPEEALRRLSQASGLAEEAVGEAVEPRDAAGAHLNAALVDEELLLRRPATEAVLDRASAHAERAVELNRQLERPRELAMALREAARLQAHKALQHRLPDIKDAHLSRALDLFAEAVALFQDLGLELDCADVTLRLGMVSLIIGRNAVLPDVQAECFRTAFREARRALRMLRQLGARESLCQALQTAVHIGRSLQEVEAGATAQTLALAREGVAAARELGNREAEAYFMSQIGEISPGEPGLHPRDLVEIGAGERDEALRDHLLSWQRAREIGDRLAEGHALARLARWYAAAGQGKEALLRAHAALDIFRKLEDRRQEAAVLCTLGGLHRSRNELDEAFASYARALALSELLAEAREEGHALLGLAGVLAGRRDFAGAAERYRQASSRLQDAGDENCRARALLGLGDAQWEVNELEEALPNQETALGIFQRTGDGTGTCEALLAIGRTQRSRGDKEKAQASLAAAFSLAQPAGLRALCGSILREMGLLLHDLGRLAEARDCLREALSLHQECGNAYGAAAALFYLADVLVALGDEESALRALEDSLSLCTRFQFHTRTWVVERLAHLHLQRGRSLAAAKTEDAVCRDRAIEHFKKAVEHDPALVLAWLYLCQLALEKATAGVDEAISEAAAAFSKALETDPGSQEVAFAVVNAFVQALEGEPDPARRIAARRALLGFLREVVDIEPPLPVLWAWLGALLHDTSQAEQAPDLAAEAVRAARRSVDLAPELPGAWFILGLSLATPALVGSDELEPALAALRRAVELEPKFSRAWLALGGLLLDRAEADLSKRDRWLDEAIAALSSCVEAEPGLAAGWELLATALCEQVPGNRDSELIARAVEAGRRTSELGAGRFPLAQALALAQQSEEALTVLEEAIARGEVARSELSEGPAWVGLREHPGFLRLLDKLPEGSSPPP